MIIGDKATFAIECHHEPLPNEHRRVFGRMCLWVGGHCLGDVDEPACMLNVTEGQLERLLLRLDDLTDSSLVGLSDRALYDLIDRAIYADDDRSTEEVRADAERFFKFDLLTNGGESFDGTRSFVVRQGNRLRILLTNRDGAFVSSAVSRAAFVLTIRGFLSWIAEESQRAG